MSRISEYYKLDCTQSTLDFVDVDVFGDIKLFVDPRAIEQLDTPWGRWAHELIRDYFERVLAAVRDDRQADALVLMEGLGEPNQTHLGLSRGKAQGSGLGSELAQALYDALESSEARKSGLLQHLEDAALLIDGIRTDRISDIATNIIRQPLIAYTKQQCALCGIQREKVGAGAIWDHVSGEWLPEGYDMLPSTPDGALLLVPKVIVRRRLDLDPGEYYRRYILRYYRDRELSTPGSSLVKTLKSGRKRVFIKDVEAKVRREFGGAKRAAIQTTLQQPQLLGNYRADKERPSFQRPPLELDEFAHALGEAPTDWDSLLAAVTDLKTGAKTATKYHRAVEGLVSALFYPTLIEPHIEAEIDEGRKRVDLRYTVPGGGHGFIGWLFNNYPPLPFLYVECKNYENDLGNPELDQLVGRFNLRSGGRVGLLVNRGFTDKDKFIRRCRDAALKQRGFVIPLDDDDLTALALARKNDDPTKFFALLSNRFAKLIE
jgi:hypothetical protein